MTHSEERLSQVEQALLQITEDSSVPRNIRRAAKEAAQVLTKKDQLPTVRANAAITILDEISNDPNMPVHTRTQIWSIVSELETVTDD